MTEEITPATARSDRSWMVLLCVLAIALGTLTWSILSRQPEAPKTPSVELVDRVDQSAASAEFTPDQVVQKQIDSIRASVDNADALVICYSLASPGNRRLTGPLDRFWRMMQNEPFRQLGVCAEYKIEQVDYENELALVKVSTKGEQGGNTFRFLLVKQKDPPYTDCWMTDGVFLDN